MKDFVFNIEYFINNAVGGIASYIEKQNKILLFKTDNSYCKQIIPISSKLVVCAQTLYNYDNLIISEKSDYLKHGGIFIGKREFYNEDGTINHIENTDEYFPISWVQLEKILKDKDISLASANSISRYYDEEKDEATWSIIIKLPMEKGCLYVFDARTGELLNTKILNMRKQL